MFVNFDYCVKKFTFLYLWTEKVYLGNGIFTMSWEEGTFKNTRFIKWFYMKVLKYNDPQNLNVYERLWLCMPECMWPNFLFLARSALVHGVHCSTSPTRDDKKIRNVEWKIQRPVTFISVTMIRNHLIDSHFNIKTHYLISYTDFTYNLLSL